MNTEPKIFGILYFSWTLKRHVREWHSVFLVWAVYFFPVLSGCERLVALRLLFLFPSGLHRNLLHTHVLRDAQPQEGHADRAQRPHETGTLAKDCVRASETSKTLRSHRPLAASIFVFVCAAEGSGQDRVLLGVDFCSVLATPSSQPHSEENNLRPKWPQPLWTAQVGTAIHSANTARHTHCSP